MSIGIQNSEFRIPNSEFRIQNSEFGIQNSEFGILGPISSTSLRRDIVLKTSYEVRTLQIGFHQTIEICELLTFCRIFKTTI